MRINAIRRKINDNKVGQFFNNTEFGEAVEFLSFISGSIISEKNFKVSKHKSWNKVRRFEEMCSLKSPFWIVIDPDSPTSSTHYIPIFTAAELIGTSGSDVLEEISGFGGHVRLSKIDVDKRLEKYYDRLAQTKNELEQYRRGYLSLKEKFAER